MTPHALSLPSFQLGSRAALDFACTSGLKAGFVFLSAQDGSAASTAYETRNCSYLHTANHCKEDGILFIPMIMESSGGSWGPKPVKVGPVSPVPRPNSLENHIPRRRKNFLNRFPLFRTERMHSPFSAGPPRQEILVPRPLLGPLTL